MIKTVFFLLLFSTAVFPQDFIWTRANPWGDIAFSGPANKSNIYAINGIDVLLREKLMPYHIEAIKKNAISKETHVREEDTLLCFYYNPDGFPIKSIESPNSRDSIISVLSYDKNNKLTSLIYNDYLNISYDRGEDGRISRVITSFYESDNGKKKGDILFTYVYDKNGILENIQSTPQIASKMIRKGKLLSFSVLSGAYEEMNINFDAFGRAITSSVKGIRSKSSYDETGRLISSTNKAMSDFIEYKLEYKNGLLNRIRITTKIGTNLVNVKPDESIELIKVDYEYAYKKQ